MGLQNFWRFARVADRDKLKRICEKDFSLCVELDFVNAVSGF